MVAQSQLVEDLAGALVTHETRGDVPSALDTIIRIAAVIDEAGDAAAAAMHMPRLLVDAATHPLFEERAEALKHLVSQRRVAGSDLDPTHPLSVPSRHPGYAILRLLIGNVLTIAEYTAALEELGTLHQSRGQAVSALHAVDARTPRKLEAAMRFISQDSRTPMLPLARFRPQAEAFAALPQAFAASRGALGFDLLDQHLMVALLNSYDACLRADVARTAGRECLFYIVTPREFDDTLSLLVNSTVPG